MYFLFREFKNDKFDSEKLIPYTLIPCHLFSTLSFTVVQEKPKCYQTNQNMEDTYHYQLFLIFPNECFTLF